MGIGARLNSTNRRSSQRSKEHCGTARSPSPSNPFRRAESVRAGITVVEVLVAAMIMAVVISFVTQLLVRIDHLWKETARQRIAMIELSNQLETLTLHDADRIPALLESLRPSAQVLGTLPEATLEGELVNDVYGPRIVLRINWKRHYRGRPVELVGWLVNSRADSDSELKRIGDTP